MIALSMTGGMNTERGIAGLSFPEDFDILNASWYYNYGVSSGLLSDSRYIPLIVNGLPTEYLPQDYNGYVMVFSEPDGDWDPELNAQVCAERYNALLQYYPDATFVVGGTIGGNVEWVAEFLFYADAPPEYWHTHYYLWHEGDAPQMVQDITALHDLVDVPIWVTETGSPSARSEAFSAALLFFETTDWIERYAVWPLRADYESPYFPGHWDPAMGMVDYNTGEITVMGETFRDFEVYNVYLPLVIR